jgi:hypothetical protein
MMDDHHSVKVTESKIISCKFPRCSSKAVDILKKDSYLLFGIGIFTTEDKSQDNPYCQIHKMKHCQVFENGQWCASQQNHNFCEHHRCNTTNCEERSWFKDGKCREHTEIRNCPLNNRIYFDQPCLVTVPLGKIYCKDHSCEEKECQSIKVDYYDKFCDKHSCIEKYYHIHYMKRCGSLVISDPDNL